MYRVAHPLLSLTSTSSIRPLGTSRSCEECLSARVNRKPIPKQTATRSDKKLRRVYVDLSGPQETRALGGKRYVIVGTISPGTCKRLSRQRRVRPQPHRTDKVLYDLRTDGSLEILRTDGGTEFEGPSEAICEGCT